MTTPARIYLRVSRPDERDILENQRMAALNYARQHDLQVLKVYEDIKSGGDDDRDGLGSLLHDLRHGDLVVFTSLSRMTRGGVGAALDILRQLEARGAGWHFTEQPVLNYDSNTSRLAKDILLAVFAAIDQDYRRRISEATKAALARRRALGVRLGRPPKTPSPSTDGGETAMGKRDDLEKVK